MIEVIYASRATKPFTPSDLDALLLKARQRNEQDNISGLLLYDHGSFLQVLEGDDAVVDATVARIRTDPRHGNILLLKRGPIDKRSFGEWRMGFLEASAASKQMLTGFSDFLRGGVTGLQADSSAVGRILTAFRDGSYHSAIR